LELQNGTSIVINKTNKGSTIVVQNRDNYIKSGLEHLQDSKTYKQLDGDPTKCICRDIISLLNDHKKEGYLAPNMVNFCMPPVNAKSA